VIFGELNARFALQALRHPAWPPRSTISKTFDEYFSYRDSWKNAVRVAVTHPIPDEKVESKAQTRNSLKAKRLLGASDDDNKEKQQKAKKRSDKALKMLGADPSKEPDKKLEPGEKKKVVEVIKEIREKKRYTKDGYDLDLAYVGLILLLWPHHVILKQRPRKLRIRMTSIIR